MKNILLFSSLLFLFSCSGTNKSKTAAKGSKAQQQEMVKKVIVGQGQTLNEAKTFILRSFSITGDTLSIDITYRGGCGESRFELYSNGMLKKSLPPQVDVYLEQRSENETCDKEIKKTLRFDISALKKPGYNLIVLNINGSENKVDWNIAQ